MTEREADLLWEFARRVGAASDLAAEEAWQGRLLLERLDRLLAGLDAPEGAGDEAGQGGA